MLVGLVLLFQVQMTPPITPPSTPRVETDSPTQAQSSPTVNNISVNVTPPPPDPEAVAAMYQFTTAQTQHDYAAVPVGWADSLLQGENIWTHTPTGPLADPTVKKVRNAARYIAMGLFTLAIIWTGIQLLLGTSLGTSTYQTLLPPLVGGFLIAMYSELIAFRMIELVNWMNSAIVAVDLPTFTADALTLPARPEINPEVPGIVSVPAGFVGGLVTSTLYALFLLVLEAKMILREGVIVVGTTIMPVSGILWAVAITHGWGVKMLALFFGWLFSQPLVVACLALSGSLLSLFLTEGPAVILVKIAILFLAIKLASFLGASLGGSGMFGLAGLLFLLRRTGALARRSGGGTSPASPAPAAPPAVAGMAGGTGGGTGATGRAWRPAYGAA